MKYEWFFQLVAGCSILFWGLEVRAGRIPASMMEIRVVDDLGAPVAGASAEAGWESGPLGIKGLTDTNGIFRFEEPITGALGCEVRKDGYYRVFGELWWGPMQGKPLPPTNQYTVVLKRIVHPVAMVKRDLSLEFPALDAPYGLDLAVGDWVAPQGKGMVADLYVQGSKQLQDYRNWVFRCLLQFTNGNGVIKHHAPGRQSLAAQSRLIPPLTAPSDGYSTKYEFSKRYHAGEGTSESAGPDDHLLFRVRAETNATGDVVSANVGWIESAIDLEGRGTKAMFLYMHYYFNPDPHSRSLEPEEIAKQQTGP